MHSCLVWPALPCWNVAGAGEPSEMVLPVWALVWQPARSQVALEMWRVTWMGAFTWPVKCTHTSREATSLVLTKFTAPGGTWHCTQSTFLWADFSHVSRSGHISWQTVPQNLLFSVNLTARTEPPRKSTTSTTTTMAMRFHHRDHHERPGSPLTCFSGCGDASGVTVLSGTAGSSTRLPRTLPDSLRRRAAFVACFTCVVGGPPPKERPRSGLSRRLRDS